MKVVPRTHSPENGSAMKNYLLLMKELVDSGRETPNRTGVTALSLTGRTLRWDLADGFPILTTRRVSVRLAFEETLFFLRGETQTKSLERKGIAIWKGNTSAEFLASRGLAHLPEGDMGKGYGYQIRNFAGTGCDQLVRLLDGLRDDPYGRRHVVSHWCPNQLDECALPPCHVMHAYSVRNGRLDSSFIMRSSDAYHGLPYNVMSYALLNHLFARHLGLEPGELVYFGHDVHLYSIHLSAVESQLAREPRLLPQLVVKKPIPTLNDLLALQFEDIELAGYDPHPALQKLAMVV